MPTGKTAGHPAPPSPRRIPSGDEPFAPAAGHDWVVGGWHQIRVHADVVRALNRPETRAKLAEGYFEVITHSTPEEFQAQIRRQIDLVGKIVRGAGIKPAD